MTSFENNTEQINQYSPWSSLLIFVLLFILATVVSQLIGAAVAIMVADVPLSQLQSIFTPPYDNSIKSTIYVAQGLSHFLGFTLFSLFYLKVVDRQALKSYFSTKRFNGSGVLLVIGSTFTFMLFNSIIIDWNMHIQFPDFLSDFEKWARATEDQLIELTNLLSTYDNFGEMLIAMLVIGILPAIGEELVFRGLLQNKLQVISGNVHVAIWLAAIIFGVFHLQFYGVFPRILLGALFGYIYYYSANIWYPILAHFINNGLAVLIMYIGPRVDENWNPEAMDSEMPLYISLSALLIFAFLFKNFIEKQRVSKHG